MSVTIFLPAFSVSLGALADQKGRGRFDSLSLGHRVGQAARAACFTNQQGGYKRSFAEVATIRQRLFIWLLGPDLRLVWPTEAITAP